MTIAIWYYEFMQQITSIPLTPRYKKDNGVYVLDAQNMPLPDGFALKESSLVYLPAGEVAGNHRHPRQEAFICFQKNVELHWLDTDGKKHIQPMNDADGNAPLFIVPSMVPHAVVNTSKNIATIMAYADGPLVDVESLPVAETS